MGKYFLIIALFTGINFKATSQTVSEKKERFKIDSVKRNLPSLKGADRIDALISLCKYYYDMSQVSRGHSLDTVRYYGNKILNESKIIGYKKGIAMGLVASASDSLREKNAREAIRIGEEIKNDEVLGWGYSVLNRTVRDYSQNIMYYQKSIDHFYKAGNILRGCFEKTWLCQVYSSIGENEKAFDCARENLETLKKVNSSEFPIIYTQSLLWSYWNMSEIFSAAGDYEEALKYIQKTDEVDRANNPATLGWSLDISGIYAELGQYDSALLYWNRFRNVPNWDDSSFSWRPGKKLAYNYLARLYAMNKQYDKAISILTDNVIYFDSLLKYTTGNYQNAGNYGKMFASITLSRIYDTLKNYKTSLQYGKDGFHEAQAKNRRPEMMQACLLLSRAYHNLHNNDSAYIFLEKYIILKDSIQTKQFLLRIYNSKREADDAKREADIALLNSDNRIKQQQLRQESQQKNFLLLVLSALLLAGVFVYRTIYLKRKNERLKLENALAVQNLESEKKHAELKRQAVELEMQALRAQMNPHFIFNCLSSINRFIFKNDNKEASDYLTRFSRLIRMVLIHSQKQLIPLEDELEMLRLYLDMERLRFKNAFDYSITTTNAVESGSIFIPPLLLQPFCENAIWHGLMHKEGKGHLNISINEENRILHCIITDDGVGRAMAATLKSKSVEKEKSLGLQITAKRLSLLSSENSPAAFYEIEDLRDENGNAAGTKVNLMISYKRSVEEIV